jgi:hypothetical protein
MGTFLKIESEYGNLATGLKLFRKTPRPPLCASPAPHWGRGRSDSTGLPKIPIQVIGHYREGGITSGGATSLERPHVPVQNG